MPTKQEMLANIEEAINTFAANGAVVSYTIGDRTIRRSEIDKLTILREKLKAEIAQENGSRNYASFKRPL